MKRLLDFLRLQIECPIMVLGWPVLLRPLDVRSIERNENGMLIVLNKAKVHPDDFIAIETREDVVRVTKGGCPNWFSEPHLGAAAIGVFILGFPGLIFLGPFMLIGSLLNSMRAKRHGMNQRLFTAWRMLSPQLQPEDAAILKEALQSAAENDFAWTSLGLSYTWMGGRAVSNF